MTLPVLLLLLLLPSLSAARYSGGSGEPNDPYRIATPNDLNDIGNHPNNWDQYFVMTNDINMAGFTYTTALIAPDEGMDPVGFSGVFDGNGHRITNITIDTEGVSNYDIGLFGRIVENGSVMRLGVEDVNITGGGSSGALGALAGINDNGTISNCYSTGRIRSGNNSHCLGGLAGVNAGQLISCHSTVAVSGREELGGLAGRNVSGHISTCYATGAVTGHNYLGGLVGRVGNPYVVTPGGTISNCYATGDVSGSNYLGGLVGANGVAYHTDGSDITNCYASGSVTGGYGSDCLGGLLGFNEDARINNSNSTGSVLALYDSYSLGGLVGSNMGGGVTNCCSTSPVSGYHNVGGLVGRHNLGVIRNCYSAGSVSGSVWVGGFVGYCNGCGIYDCFWDKFTSEQVEGVGFGSPAGTEGKTTLEMKTRSTFTEAGWDFVGETVNGPNDIWRMCLDGVSYPLLSWEFPIADLLCPDGVDFVDYSHLASRWRQVDCAAMNDCGRADLDFSGAVDWGDLKIFCHHWLDAVAY
jgi:hypothetical protein